MALAGCSNSTLFYTRRGTERDRGIRITSVFTWQVARQDGALGQVGWHILHGVHRNIDVAVQERSVDLLCEQTLAPNISKWLVQHLVACTSRVPSQLVFASLKSIWEQAFEKKNGTEFPTESE